MWLDEEHRLKFAVVLRWWFSSRMTSKYLTADLEIVITQVLSENARKPLSIGYLAFSLCSDILAALSVF